MGVEHDFRSAPPWEHFVAASCEVNENLAVDKCAGEAADFAELVGSFLPVYRACAEKAEGKRGSGEWGTGTGEAGTVVSLVADANERPTAAAAASPINERRLKFPFMTIRSYSLIWRSTIFAVGSPMEIFGALARR